MFDLISDEWFLNYEQHPDNQCHSMSAELLRTRHKFSIFYDLGPVHTQSSPHTHEPTHGCTSILNSSPCTSPTSPHLTIHPRPISSQIQSHTFPISWSWMRAWGHLGAKGANTIGHGEGSDKQQQQLRLYRYPGPGGWYVADRGPPPLDLFSPTWTCLWLRFDFSFATV